MADPIQILIKAILEKTSKQQLEAELRNIEQKLKPIDVKVQVDKIKEYEEASGKVKKIVTDTTDQLGRQISTTEKLIGATGTWEKTGRVVTSNYKQQRIEMDKIHIEALKLNDTYHRQHINQQKMLTTIRGIREKDAPFISSQNLKSLNELENAIIRLDPKSAQYTQRMREHELQLKKITTETGIYRQKIHEAGRYTNIFGQNLLEAGKKFAGWMLMGSIIMGIIRQLRFAITTLKEIDTELVNIAKITDYTKQEMQDLVKTAIAAGQELGRTAQEYLKAVTTFARAGFGKQAEEYAKLSLLLQNVGDVTAEVANETLIATNAGFQLQGSYQALMGIIDKFNNISNKNATTVEKMSEAMKVGASVFHSAGMSIDETVAIVGTATASTQRAGTEISRAWRTILMNIRQVKDEEAEVTEESMAKAEKALSSIGIIVRDSPQTFRPMFEILRDLGTRWEKLTEVEKAYVAESLAGKRQANVLISTLQNWDMVEKQLIESIEAEGSALRENEIYMQSWEARVKQLTASITSFWSNLINTDAIKSSISLLNSLVKIFDVLINNQFSQAIIKIGLYTGAFLLLNKILIMFRSSQLLALVAMISFDIATKGLTATIYGLAAAVYANPLFWPV
ncbi:MAG: phage tail tape measure protein, partial [Methanofastidiosum sp.]